MFRRLNFLLPNHTDAEKVVAELHQLGITDNDIHAVAEHNLPIGDLPAASFNQASDKAHKIEDLLWRGNLALFFIALMIFFISLFAVQYLLSAICLALMTLSFALGNFFSCHIPHIHLDQFKHALSHNELLVMVDVPDEKAAEIEDKIHRHHPAVVEGGSSWAIKGADL